MSVDSKRVRSSPIKGGDMASGTLSGWTIPPLAGHLD